MKIIISIISITLFLASCQPSQDNSAQMTFEKNSQTVLAFLEDWQNEEVDYDQYFAEDFWMRPTSFGSKDSVGLEDMMSSDKWNWAEFDHKKPEDMVLLPGVNAETKEVDGSVRYYGIWTITRPTSKNTEALTAKIKVYQSYDFNEDGKITFLQTYGDWGGMRDYLEDNKPHEEHEDMDEMQDVDEAM